MTESEDSIESYWEVIRPHLIERARQRRLSTERAANRYYEATGDSPNYLKMCNEEFRNYIKDRKLIYINDVELDGYKFNR